MTVEALITFAITCLIIELTPGPNMAYLAVLSAVEGRRAGFAATLGIATGLLTIGLAAAFGLAAVIANSDVLYGALRWAGVVYLLWLAYDGWRDASEASPAVAGVAGNEPSAFARGLITNLLNPKAAVFYVAMLPGFVDPSRPVLNQTVILTIIYVAIATAVHSTIVALAGAAQPFLEDEQRSRTARRGLSLALAAIAVWFAITTAK